ncbi:MAG: hypothetical protein JWO31_3880 [Phycisphaerales bacterium]|nr:hypothetical protein [Phycisphaerales bacterium]
MPAAASGPQPNMRRVPAAILCLLYAACTGCCPKREENLCRVVDVADLRPIPGATVWMQPWAPIHPFWPAGDRDVTDAAGEARLSLPAGYWWYFSRAGADGYSPVADPDKRPPQDHRELHTTHVFYLSRDPTGRP